MSDPWNDAYQDCLYPVDEVSAEKADRALEEVARWAFPRAEDPVRRYLTELHHKGRAVFDHVKGEL